MSDDSARKHQQLVTRGAALPAEPPLIGTALGISGPFGVLGFRMRARASMKAMQTAMEHAKVFGELMGVARQTISEMQKTQDAAREYAVRQHLGAQLYDGEVDRQSDQLAEQHHQRELGQKRRAVEHINADTEILSAQQAHRAKKKFEKHKHAAGEARFEGKIADRKLGAAAARAAMDEAAGQATFEPQKESAEADKEKPDGTVSSLIGEFIKLQDEILEGERDGKDTTELRSDRDALKRLIERLQNKPQ